MLENVLWSFGWTFCLAQNINAHHQNKIPTVAHGGGSTMLWGVCFQLKLGSSGTFWKDLSWSHHLRSKIRHFNQGLQSFMSTIHMTPNVRWLQVVSEAPTHFREHTACSKLPHPIFSLKLQMELLDKMTEGNYLQGFIHKILHLLAHCISQRVPWQCS